MSTASTAAAAPRVWPIWDLLAISGPAEARAEDGGSDATSAASPLEVPGVDRVDVRRGEAGVVDGPANGPHDGRRWAL
jgi:hypothetical protein